MISIESAVKQLEIMGQAVPMMLSLLSSYHEFLSDARRIEFSDDLWRPEEDCTDCDPYSFRFTEILDLIEEMNRLR